MFFSVDLNLKTRNIIADILEKLLIKEPNNEDVWKVVWEYFEDK